MITNINFLEVKHAVLETLFRQVEGLLPRLATVNEAWLKANRALSKFSAAAGTPGTSHPQSRPPVP